MSKILGSTPKSENVKDSSPNSPTIGGRTPRVSEHSDCALSCQSRESS